MRSLLASASVHTKHYPYTISMCMCCSILLLCSSSKLVMDDQTWIHILYLRIMKITPIPQVPFGHLGNDIHSVETSKY